MVLLSEYNYSSTSIIVVFCRNFCTVFQTIRSAVEVPVTISSHTAHSYSLLITARKTVDTVKDNNFYKMEAVYAH